MFTKMVVGVCGMQEQLQQRLSHMLEQIRIVDECDILVQKMEGTSGENIHMVCHVHLLYLRVRAYVHKCVLLYARPVALTRVLGIGSSL